MKILWNQFISNSYIFLALHRKCLVLSRAFIFKGRNFLVRRHGEVFIMIKNVGDIFKRSIVDVKYTKIYDRDYYRWNDIHEDRSNIAKFFVDIPLTLVSGKLGSKKMGKKVAKVSWGNLKERICQRMGIVPDPATSQQNLTWYAEE